MIALRRADLETMYLSFLERWNERDAHGMAAMCAPHGYVIGFDGSELNGRDSIEAELRRIFAHHKTPAYVAKIRSVEIFDDVALLRAVVGMVENGARTLNPDLNAIQTFVVSRHGSAWQVEVLQSTPATFHGRPQAREALTDELLEVFRAGRR